MDEWFATRYDFAALPGRKVLLLGLGGGCDMSVVIRTIVMQNGVATIGVGGAIVMQSEPGEEYQETLLKARAPMAAIDPRADPHTVFAAAPGALIGA